MKKKNTLRKNNWAAVRLKCTKYGVSYSKNDFFLLNYNRNEKQGCAALSYIHAIIYINF